MSLVDAGDDPTALLELLRRRLSERKMRLFAAACCRLVWAAIDWDEDQKAVELAERLADGQATEEERARAYATAGEGPAASFMAGDCVAGYEDVLRIEAGRAANATSGGVFAARGALYHLADAARAAGLDPAPALQTAHDYLRDVGAQAIADRPVCIEPIWLAWHDGAVVSLARTAYDERELPSGRLPASQLAILADALEEAGCTSHDLLAHLRGPGPHIRGCWALDLLLDKT